MQTQQRKDTKQRRQVGPDLSESIRSNKEIANHYDQMSNDMLTIADTMTTKFVNGMVLDAKVEGEIAGKEGAEYDVDAQGNATAPKGYTREREIFSWNRSFNNASQASFQQQTNSQVSGFTKNVAKKSNGNQSEYQTVMKQMKTQAMGAVDDPRQKQHISNAYDSAYAQNLQTVTTQGLKLEKVRLTDSWKFSRQEFSDSLAIKTEMLMRSDTKRANATKDFKALDPHLPIEEHNAKSESLADIQEENDRLHKEYEDMVAHRFSSSIPAINVGAITVDQAKFDTREDMKTATITAEKYNISKRNSDVEGSDYEYKPNPMLNARENDEVKQALHEHIASVNSAEIVQEKRTDREFKELRESTNTYIKGSILNLNDDEITSQPGVTEEMIQTSTDTLMTDIQDSYKAGLISKVERDYYVDELLNGNPVKSDDMATYSTINSNIENWTAEKIIDEPGLTDATRKKFLKDRETWETSGEEWMKLPDYSEGKNIIRGAFGFSEADIIPEFLTGNRLEKYLEMQRVVEQYRSEVRAGSAKGDRNIAVDIAGRLINEQNQDARSSLYKTRDEKLTLTKEHVTKALDNEKKTTENVKKLLDTQLKKFPSTEVSKGAEDLYKPKPVVKEEPGFFSSLYDDVFGDGEPKMSKADVRKQAIKDGLLDSDGKLTDKAKKQFSDRVENDYKNEEYEDPYAGSN